LVELGRKLVLNGFLVICNQGTILQLTVALVVVLIHLMAIIHTKPMLHISNNSFYPYTTFLLFAVFLASILLQVETSFVQSGFGDAGYNKTLVLVLLFGATIGVLLFGVYFLAKDIAQSRKHSLMCDDKGTIISFRKLSVEAFHLFLSHTWATGQVRLYS
jgi:magnesium-transporting ATPase (P-type)